MNKTHTFAVIGLFALSALIIGCGKSEEKKEAAQAGSETVVDPATAATIAGKVLFDGAAPAAATIAMNADPVCMQQHTAPVAMENVVVNANGTLKNVFVYVKKGLEGKTFPTPTDPVVVTQEGCTYHPHVLGMMVNQPVKFVNGDATLHNLHAVTTVNEAFNIGQPSKGMEAEKTFDKPEVMVKMKCDVHPWMSSFIGVLEHPYFAVTGEEGSFSLKNLPPGSYTIEAWQEEYGAQTQEVTVGPKETKQITFSFKAK